MKKWLSLTLNLLAISLITVFVVACGGEEATVEPTAASTVMEADMEADHDADMDADMEADMEADHDADMEMDMEADHDAEHDSELGVVLPKPADVPQVDVILGEWSVIPNPRTVPAGQVYFLVENSGQLHPHELVIVKTDLAPNELPVVDRQVDESKVEVIGEIEEFAKGTSASGLFDLEPGNYLLICNTLETVGAMESHYEQGMSVAFTVQ